MAIIAGQYNVMAAEQGGTAVKPEAVEAAALRHEAQQLEEAGRFTDAAALYEKVLILEPGDFATKRKLQDLVLEHAGDSERYYIQQQLMEVEAQSKLIRAQRLYEEQQIQAALDELDHAEMIHMRTKKALTQEDLIKLHELRITLFRARQEFELIEREKQRLINQQQMVLKVRENEERERSIFEQRMSRISTYVRKGLYEEALTQTRRLVKDYPGEPASDQLFVMVIDLAHKQRQLNFDESMEELKREIRHQMHEHLIPQAWDGYPIYPDDWETRINSRKVEYFEVELPAWQIALQNKVAERTSVYFEDQDVGDALDFLSTRLGINIVVDSEVRASGAVVNLQARNMTVGNILSWLAEQVDSQWQYDNEAIYFGEPKEVDSVIRVYDVGQLVYHAPDFPGVELLLGDAGLNGGGGGGLFDDVDTNSDGGIAPEDLIDLIQSTVNPVGWDENDDWGVRVRGSLLMITASPDTHLQIQDFIKGLSNINDLVVNIQAKWVTIQDRFVEEIGVDWINPGRIDGAVGDSIHPQQPLSNSAENDFSINVEHVLPNSAVDTANTIINRGLRLDFAILDAIQAVAVFEAVQFKEIGHILEDISVSVHNGARANAFVGRTIAYIGDYDVTTGANNSTLQPEISNLSVGAALDVKPFVSSDRKYVSLDLRPSFSTVEFSIAEIVALTTNAGFASQQFFPIELPIVRNKHARTRVMIPDKGTLLAGGFGEHIEQNSYAQIPVLGNLPFIGRLFGKRAIREQRSSLYLTVTAKIIMFSELETLQ